MDFESTSKDFMYKYNISCKHCIECLGQQFFLFFGSVLSINGCKSWYTSVVQLHISPVHYFYLMKMLIVYVLANVLCFIKLGKCGLTIKLEKPAVYLWIFYCKKKYLSIHNENV